MKKKLENLIVAGEGYLALGVGTATPKNSEEKLPYITFSVTEKENKTGSLVDPKDEKMNVLTILFKNIESLEILENMCVRAREVFNEK